MDWNKLMAVDLYAKMGIRSSFDKDFDRIIFSHPFRRLQDKTQVHPLPEHDFVHNRLTHSLEVSSVARSLGRAVGEQVLADHPALKASLTAHDFGTIVASAALAHDIGNPPFGHSGEASISDYFKEHQGELESLFSPLEWADLTNFEGNAQGLRLIAKSGADGLKLTLPTVAAFIKYPKPSLVKKTFKNRKSQKKYGYFSSEQQVFQGLVENLGMLSLSQGQYIRHPLAFLVEAADDICYNVIDLEDGCNLGLVSYEQTISLFGQILGDQFMPEKLEKVALMKDRIGLLRALSISQLVNQCVKEFISHQKEIMSGEYDMALTDQIEAAQVLSEIQFVSIEKIYRSKKVVEIEAAGYQVLNGLLGVFVPALVAEHQGQKAYKYKLALRLLPEDLTIQLKHEVELYEKLRLLLDFISGMTDSYAVNLHRKINGTTLPGMI